MNFPYSRSVTINDRNKNLNHYFISFSYYKTLQNVRLYPENARKKQLVLTPYMWQHLYDLVFILCLEKSDDIAWFRHTFINRFIAFWFYCQSLFSSLVEFMYFLSFFAFFWLLPCKLPHKIVILLISAIITVCLHVSITFHCFFSSLVEIVRLFIMKKLARLFLCCFCLFDEMTITTTMTVTTNTKI